MTPGRPLLRAVSATATREGAKDPIRIMVTRSPEFADTAPMKNAQVAA